MSNTIKYKEATAFHPGYYVSDIIDDMGISQSEFAERLGTTAKTLSKLINGQANISNDLAKKLSIMTGTSVALWQNLQNTYDQKIIEIEKARDFDEQKEIVKLIDYKYFIKVAGLPDTKKPEEKIENLCKYLKVSDLRIMCHQDYLVNYRSTGESDSEKRIVNSRVWLQTALNEAEYIETCPYSAKKLKKSLPELRNLTIQDPHEFMPRMKEIFAECGVAFVLLPHLKNSGVNGAVKWVRKDRAVLAMNNRGLEADRFWFSLFHEVKHVLQQKTKTVFISSSFDDINSMNHMLEDEADRFASDLLIPPAELERFAPTRLTSDDEITKFAESIGIHPGIVAGRLQRDHIIEHNRCNGLKEKYIIEIQYSR